MNINLSFCLFKSSSLSSKKIPHESLIQNTRGKCIFLFSRLCSRQHGFQFDLHSSLEHQESFTFRIYMKKLKLQVVKFSQAPQQLNGMYFSSGLFGSKESMKNLFKNLQQLTGFPAKLYRLHANPAHLHLTRTP